MGRTTVQNNLTDAESIAGICQENKLLLQDFLDYLRSIQRSDGTVAAYQNDIEIAFVWCEKNIRNIPFVKWTKRNIMAYQNFLVNECKHSPARVRRLKAALSSLSNFIETILDDEYPNFRNIINKIESPVNQPVREKTVLSREQVETLLTALTESGRYEKACLFALAAFSGRRKAELLRFKVSYFGEENIVYGSLYKTPEPVRSKGRGKNGKPLVFYTLAKEFKPYLDRWLQYREEHGIESEWLFPNHLDPARQMPAATITKWAEECGKIIGVDLYMHSFRHFYTTELARNNIPSSVIQTIIGWESADMVAIYDDTSADEQLGKYFGEEGIKKVETGKLGDL